MHLGGLQQPQLLVLGQVRRVPGEVGQLGRATIFIYLAISLTTQGVVLRQRAHRYSSNVISGGATRNNRVR
ncbi:hypothetical protein ACFQ1S_31005 [Kibdelosporangium lantanae]|uniref:Uncharacterized protein n=1 Tax=Kibdelosporangium lantanae TaxID=1497396 RepID=A0ABW3MHU1_9PSEU